MDYDKEVEAIRIAHEESMLTIPCVFNEEITEAMIKAEADIIVTHRGPTAKGVIGARTTMSLKEAAKRCQAIADTARSLKHGIIVLVREEPIAELNDFKYISEHIRDIHDFLGASTFEKIPIEKAISETVKSIQEFTFKVIILLRN